MGHLLILPLLLHHRSCWSLPIHVRCHWLWLTWRSKDARDQFTLGGTPCPGGSQLNPYPGPGERTWGDGAHRGASLHSMPRAPRSSFVLVLLMSAGIPKMTMDWLLHLEFHRLHEPLLVLDLRNQVSLLALGVIRCTDESCSLSKGLRTPMCWRVC